MSCFFGVAEEALSSPREAMRTRVSSRRGVLPARRTVLDHVALDMAADPIHSPRWETIVQENAAMVSVLHNGASRALDIEEKVCAGGAPL